jgi:hypothetical protein
MSQDDKEDEEIRLRDQVAIAAMQALIDRYTAKVDSGWIGQTGPKQIYYDDACIIAQMAYIMADAMRKARLKVFD